MFKTLTLQEEKEAECLFHTINGCLRDSNEFYQITTKTIAAKVIQLLQVEYEFFTNRTEPQSWYEYSFEANEEANEDEILFRVRCN